MGTRANINLDADAYSFASAYASAKGIPLGAAVSELLRQREKHMPEPSIMASGRLTINSLGLLVIANTGEVVTPDMAKDFSEDEFD